MQSSRTTSAYAQRTRMVSATVSRVATATIGKKRIVDTSKLGQRVVPDTTNKTASSNVRDAISTTLDTSIGSVLNLTGCMARGLQRESKYEVNPYIGFLLGSWQRKSNITKTKLQRSSEIEAYDKWISANYDGLMKYAKKYHSSPHDLIHHVYLKIRELPNLQKILDGYIWGYHQVSLFRHAKSGRFNRDYKLLDGNAQDGHVTNDFQLVVLREEVDLVLSQLDFFDRAIFELRMEGESMTTLAKESGISVHTIYYSLRKTTKLLKDRLC